MSDTERTLAHAEGGLHGDAPSHGDGPEPQPLGPVDVTAWAYALGGSAVGVVLALAMLVASAG